MSKKESILNGLRRTFSDNKISGNDVHAIRIIIAMYNNTNQDSITKEGYADYLTKSLTFDLNYAELLGSFAFCSTESFLLFKNYIFSTIIGSPKKLEILPHQILLNESFKNGIMSRDEIISLKYIFTTYSDFFYQQYLNDLSYKYNIDNNSIVLLKEIASITVQQLKGYFDGGFVDNIRIIRNAKTNKHEFKLKINLTIFSVLADVHLAHEEYNILYSLLQGKTEANAKSFLEENGIGNESAKIIAKQFTRKDFNQAIGNKLLLEINFKFDKIPKKFELTPESKHNLGLGYNQNPPYKITPNVGNFDPTILPQPVSLQIEDNNKYLFERSQTAFKKGVTFEMIIDMNLPGQYVDVDDLYDTSKIGRFETAFSYIPDSHLKFLNFLVFTSLRSSIINPGIPARASVNNNKGWMYLYTLLFGMLDQEVNNIIIHEFGHLVHLNQTKKDNNFLTKTWKDAINKDKYGFSLHGLKNEAEDFAEAYLTYLVGGKSDPKIRQLYSHRFHLLDNI